MSCMKVFFFPEELYEEIFARLSGRFKSQLKLFCTSVFSLKKKKNIEFLFKLSVMLFNVIIILNSTIHTHAHMYMAVH